MKTKINFRKSNDKIWTKLNEELEIIIPKVFTKSVINKLSTSNLFEILTCGFIIFSLNTLVQLIKEPHIKGVFKRKPRINKDLQHLRQRKKECKKARKALMKAGLKGSPEEKLISKEWFSLVRQHNKLRVALNKKF